VTQRAVERWDEVPLDKVTEMVSRKEVDGGQLSLVQLYLKRGAQVPLHRHEGDQMVYVLEGALLCSAGGRTVTVSEGEVWSVPSGVRHQAVALDDTFQLVIRSER
jgi:quercetin dioxygenase-like cupin family protein